MWHFDEIRQENFFGLETPRKTFSVSITQNGREKFVKDLFGLTKIFFQKPLISGEIFDIILSEL